ncbi:pre-rRNA-processing protein TSR1 homolog isoform X2 [Takifugu flavidus]|uniref:Pre-rRNA-processing protein TSR1 homolog n=1 Tax=Takifugu flavidus TaxID=433684 RepID=A0A5C6PCB8_9TELE|nr:pre-rRNA-processing protein TSR1 homolog isoform X2 [Takifugu flavidus]TWW77045.1 Pre-rRNA-processing protein TSR1 -like protein [Takifugu flavidus]
MAATEEKQQGHRPGAYKQKNKVHKHGKHRTKGEVERENKGRVSVTALTKKQRKEQKKIDRRNKANQLRRNKKDMILTEKRRLGGRDGPPHLVAVVSLHTDADASSVTKMLRRETVGGIVHQEQCVSGLGDSFGLILPRFKQRFTFLHQDTADMHSLLDMAKIADSLLFVLDAAEGWDDYGDYCLSCLFAQGLPSHALVCLGVSDLPVKKRVEARRALSKIVEVRFPDTRLFPLDSDQDATLLLRHLGSQKQRKLGFRSRRSHLLAQCVTFTPSDHSEGSGGGPSGLGTLCVSGYVRGRPLRVDRLVHISGHGDFQLSQIDAPSDPLPLNLATGRSNKSGRGGDVDMQDGGDNEAPVRVLMKADPTTRESLQAEAEVDPMEGEQTWPTESELLEAEEARKNKRVMKVPKGTSDYQATWIVDEDDNGELKEESSEEEEDDDDEMLDEAMDDEDEDICSQTSEGEEEEEEEEEEEVCPTERTGADQRYDEHMDEAAEEEGLRRYREARANEMFPDEVDTPIDAAARIRFQRYRGLKSFRTSPWDPMENLPQNYSRIFQFQNFERTRRRILAEAAAEEDGAMVGWYVTLHIMDVPSSVMDSVQAGRPLTLVSLLPHEQKMSVMHVLVRRHPSNTEPIKSKEELVFHCGFRRFRASPIFSQHTTADKHKMERFLRPDAPTVVSVYAPITFSPAGVLLFKQRSDGIQDLVATGSLLSCDPQRVMLKRIVLSGHPFKINRRSAVVRYMFFNRDDILWFKPVELKTKWGRRGHIKEALGTHGHMKCVFDSQLRSQDTVLMNLYKRVYPRWTYDPYVPSPLPWVKKEGTVELDDLDME